MIDKVSDAFCWDRKHTIKVLNGQVSHGAQTKKRDSKPSYGVAETSIIKTIWMCSEQPCSLRLKETFPLWIGNYEKRYGEIEKQLPFLHHHEPSRGGMRLRIQILSALPCRDFCQLANLCKG